MTYKRPNILFVQTDQQRPEWVEMNPDIPVRTPHLKDDVADEFPQVFQRLSVALDEHLSH